jgi:hypothetical protein
MNKEVDQNGGQCTRQVGKGRIKNFHHAFMADLFLMLVEGIGENKIVWNQKL